VKVRVGVVEDEERARRLLGRSLTAAGLEVTMAEGVGRSEALDALAELDIVILDLMLGDLDGLSVLRALRKRSSVPVIVVTARDDLDDKLSSLRAGADDYVVKPYAVEELVARIEAVLRRHSQLGPEVAVQTGDLEVFLDTPVVRVEGRELDLTRKEYGVLAVLATNIGRVVVSDALLAKVWGEPYVGYAGVLHVTVSRLRTKLGVARDLIETRSGIGYSLRRQPVDSPNPERPSLGTVGRVDLPVESSRGS